MTILASIFLGIAIVEGAMLFFLIRSYTHFRKRIHKTDTELIKEYNSAQVNLRRIDNLLNERRPER
jgi:hypothetical protein